MWYSGGMQQTSPSFLQKVLFIVGVVALLGLSTQWFTINWGRIENAQTATINVTGEAKDLHANQIATFTAGVSVTDADRETAVEMASAQMTELVNAVKEFGIPAEDIKTENVNVYEYTVPESDTPRAMLAIMPPAPPVRGEQTWQASGSISVTLRDIDRASELTNLLASLDAVNISGPNFTTDDTTAMDDQLLREAMADARRKADLLLEGTGQKVTGVINVFENDASYPYFAREMSVSAVGSAALDMPVEPGSQTIYKTVSVTFEISR